METIGPNDTTQTKSKLARTFHRVKNLRTATKISSNNNGLCLLSHDAKRHHKNDADDKCHQRALMEAVIAKLFASATSIKASYAELQAAQTPYDGAAVQAADQSVVEELQAISDLKRRFLKKDLDLSPQVATLLAEVQEQQAIMKTYEITLKKLAAESEKKSAQAEFLSKRLDDAVSTYKASEMMLHKSSSTSTSTLSPSHFVGFLHGVTRSARSFAKTLMAELESASWDLDLAVKFIVGSSSSSSVHYPRALAFESFVCRAMFEGFDSNEDDNGKGSPFCSGEFIKSKSLSPKELFSQDPNPNSSSFSKFVRSKYLRLVHAKMECSMFGSLSQRKVVASCGFPETAFFGAFAEMAKRVWLLRRLAFSFGEEVSVFQARTGSRFSEVYMESRDGIADECFSRDSELRVGFTVVPGFMIGKTVVQCQVYLSPTT